MSVKLNEKSKVRVYNNVNGSVSFRDMNNKKWLFPNRTSFKDIELNLVVGLFNDNERYFTEGILIFDNKDVYEYLGIPSEIYNKILPMKETAKFLEEKTPEEIEEVVKEMPQAIKENIAVVAKEMKIDSNKKQKAIRKATGFDIRDEEEIIGE